MGISGQDDGLLEAAPSLAPAGRKEALPSPEGRPLIFLFLSFPTKFGGEFLFSSPVSFLVGVTSLFFGRFCGFAFHSSSAHPSWVRWLLRDARHSPRTLPTCTSTLQPPQPYTFTNIYPRNLILLQPRSLISRVPSRYLAVSIHTMQREVRGAQCEDEHTALRAPRGRFRFGRRRFLTK